MTDNVMTDSGESAALDLEVDGREAADSDARKYLSFTVAGDCYGIGILAVKEIIEYAAVTRIPMVPAEIHGVINLRGSVVPVISLAARFGCNQGGATRRTCIVIIEAEINGDSMDIGLVVDAVNRVFDVPEKDVEAAPSFGAHIRTEFIAGMGKVNEAFVILLDLPRVVDVEELAELAASDRNRSGQQADVAGTA